MKAYLALLFCFSFNVLAQNQSAPPPLSAPALNNQAPVEISPNSVVQRGPHHRIWQRVTSQTDSLGHTTYLTNSFTELGTGLNQWNGSQWVDANSAIAITPSGASAANTQHHVNFAANINTSGSIDLTLPDGRHLRSQIVGLAYYDAANSNSIMFAETKDSIGQLLPSSNQVVYANAFTDFQADVRYTHTKGKFEQDVILRSQPPSPAQYGLNPQTTLIEVWTEFLNPPEPVVSEKSVTVLGGGVRQMGSDQKLDFGTMQVGRGKAFATDSQIDRMGAVRVVKKWVHLQGRTFLVEQVPLATVAEELQKLPPTQSNGTNGTPGAGNPGASLRIKLPAPKLQAKLNRPLRMAHSEDSKVRPGLVLDYDITGSTLTDFTFQGDTTYYISDVLDLYGTSTIEGGTVIKSAPTGGGSTFHDTFVSRTSPYRPAIFTSADDSTVGVALTNGTTPTAVIVTTYLSIPDGGSVTNMRFLYAWNALGGDAADIEVSDCQFINCSHPISINADTTTLGLHNLLITMDDSVNTSVNFCSCQPGALTLYSDVVNVYGENVTANLNSQYLIMYFMYLSDPSHTTVNFTNSILITPSLTAHYWGGGTFAVTANTNTTFYASSLPAGLFQTVGAGNYYLADGSPYRNYGNTNMSAGLRKDLNRKTTYPPVVLSNITISTDTVMSPQAPRDTAANPDLGYHYDSLDFIVDGYVVTNATLTATNGVAIGCFNDWTGIALFDGSALVSIGTPVAPNWFTTYHTVQEQPIAIGPHPSPLMYVEAYVFGTTPPNGTFRFSKFTGGGGMLYNADPFSYSNLLVEDCEFWAGGSTFNGSTYSGAVTTLKNNLFVRSAPAITVVSSASLSFSNNLIWGTSFALKNFSGGSCYAFNNIFDTCTINTNGSTAISNGYNAYLNTTHSLPPNTGTDVTSGSGLAYQSGPLGNFYQPPGSSLINVGSTNANLLGLFHYTTQTNQVKETNTIVDIGYHYVAVDGSGNPIDTDGDGLADYREDSNGNGSFDVGIDLSDWNTANSDADGVNGLVELLRGRNLGTNAVLDVSGLINLNVYTPLK